MALRRVDNGQEGSAWAGAFGGRGRGRIDPELPLLFHGRQEPGGVEDGRVAGRRRR